MKNGLLSRSIRAVILLFTLSAADALCFEQHGMVTVEDYYTNDSSSAYDVNLLTTRVRLDLTKLNESGTLSFHFDGRERTRLGGGDYSSSIPAARIETLDLEYSGKSVWFSTGRLRPKEFPMERVDGVDFGVRASNYGLGVFAGIRPNPYSDSLNSSFTVAGTYVYYRKETLNASLAFAHDAYEGATDREYVYSQVTYFPTGGVMFLGMLTADIDQLGSGVNITNGIFELSYRPDGRKGIAAGFNEFRATRYYRSINYDFVDSGQKAFYISGNYRALDKLNLYGRVERQARDYPSLTGEFKHAYAYTAGVNADNLGSSGVNMDLSWTLNDSFDSRHNYYRVDFSRMSWEVLQVNVTGTYRQNQYGYINSDNVWSLGASGMLFIGKRWTVYLSLDHEDGREYTSNYVLSRLSFKF